MKAARHEPIQKYVEETGRIVPMLMCVDAPTSCSARFQAPALTFIHKSVQDRYLDLDVGRNKITRRQPGWAFPAIGAPETPVLRLTRGQAYSGLRQDVYNDERSSLGMQNTTFQRCVESG
jgi:hypothetical protein